MTTREIIQHLKISKTNYSNIKSFSSEPGVYAIYFIGNDFPGCEQIRKGDLIYIGKTESSQEKRDAKTHFSTGKTGSSTLRKSIGSLLMATLKLKPIPRNSIDFEKRRYSHFMFDETSEQHISDWMFNNLALSFFGYSAPKAKINALETILIGQLSPILNIAKNRNNSFKYELQNKRKECANIAHNIIR